MEPYRPSRFVNGITRGATHTAYTIGDVINGGTAVMLRFKDIAPLAGMPFYIIRAFIIDSVAAATPGQILVNFFSRKIDIEADDAAFDPSFSDLQYFLGSISMADYVKFANNSILYDDVFTPLLLIPESQSRDVYAVLTAVNAYDPAAYENLVLVLDTAQHPAWVP